MGFSSSLSYLFEATPPWKTGRPRNSLHGYYDDLKTSVGICMEAAFKGIPIAGLSFENGGIFWCFFTSRLGITSILGHRRHPQEFGTSRLGADGLGDHMPGYWIWKTTLYRKRYSIRQSRSILSFHFTHRQQTFLPIHSLIPSPDFLILGLPSSCSVRRHAPFAGS